MATDDRGFLYTVYRPGNAAGCERRRCAIACWHCWQIIEARDHDADPSKERGRQAYATTLLSYVKRLKDVTSYSKERGMGDREGRKRESLALGDAAVTRQMVSDVRPFAGR